MLSIVIATHNEALNIEKCLESVRPIADEVIVVDGESTDDTVALAKKMGAKVISTTNKANFHINKQLAMDEAKGDLVLQLDADEIVDSELKEFIKKIQLGEQSSTNAWWIKRKNFFMGTFLKKGGQYPDPVIRLYRKGKARLPQKDVHEQMVVDGEVGWVEGHLLHYGNPTFNDYLRKFNTYTSFKAAQLKEQKVRISFFNTVDYCFFKQISTFLSLFLRHRGYVDGVAGFVFALFSGLHHFVAYLKLWELYVKNRI